MLPEEKARIKIDEQLTSAGWEVVTRFEYNRKNPSAIVEASMSGRKESDYLLLSITKLLPLWKQNVLKGIWMKSLHNRRRITL